MRPGSSKFANIVEAIRALRTRKIMITPITNTPGTLSLILTHPALVQDRDFIREVMALGVDLFKIERNIQD